MGFKMLYMALYHLGLRGMVEPEALHSKWNDARRSLKAAGLTGSVLKGTLLANLSHGYFLGGKNSQQKEEVLEHLANDLDISDYLDDVAFDRDLQHITSHDSLLDELRSWHSHSRTLKRGAMANWTQ